MKEMAICDRKSEISKSVWKKDAAHIQHLQRQSVVSTYTMLWADLTQIVKPVFWFIQASNPTLLTWQKLCQQKSTQQLHNSF